MEATVNLPHYGWYDMLTKRTFLSVSVLILSLTAVGYGNVIQVPSDQPTIQAGIDAAVDGDTVLVANGTYTGDGNRDIDFYRKKIHLKSKNGPRTTIIDCEGTYFDPHRGFKIHRGENSSTVIDGFTVRNGNAPKELVLSLWGRSIDGRFGGAIFIRNSTPKIMNCVLEDNYSLNQGGGVFVIAPSNSTVNSVSLENCIIGDNSAWLGGGLAGWNGSVHLKNCTIAFNKAFSYETTDEDGSGGYFVAGEGGAVFHQWNSLEVVNCNVVFNNAEESASVEDCISGSICGTATINCSNFYGNTYGDIGTDFWGSIGAFENINRNFSADPLFCDTANANFHIANTSPCAPENNGCGELIGALGLGCDPTCGDLNADSFVDVADLHFLLELYFFDTLQWPDHWHAADMNCDGWIRLDDIILLAGYVGGYGPPTCCDAPPPERPDWSTDEAHSVPYD